jgi:hypothetical protein
MKYILFILVLIFNDLLYSQEMALIPAGEYEMGKSPEAKHTRGMGKSHRSGKKV